MYVGSNRGTEHSSQMSDLDIEQCCLKQPLYMRSLNVHENASEISSICSDSDFINLFCNAKLLQASKRSVYLGDHKETASMTPLTKCVCCNWSVCSQRCQDSLVYNTECQATQGSGISIGVEHFDQINMMYACIAVLRALSLHDGSRKPGTIKEATKVKKVSNNESTLDDWLKGSEQDTNEDSIPDELPDIDNVIDKDSNEGVKNALNNWVTDSSNKKDIAESEKNEQPKLKSVI